MRMMKFCKILGNLSRRVEIPFHCHGSAVSIANNILSLHFPSYSTNREQKIKNRKKNFVGKAADCV